MLADAVLTWTIVGVGVAVVVAGLTGWLVAQGHAARKASAHEAEIALSGVAWQFRFQLRPVVGAASPTQPPVEIRTVGANVWVHTVRLSWMPSQPGGTWTIDDADCPPWRVDESPPVQLFTTGRALELAWPEPNPDQQVQLHTRLRVQWSATKKGPKHWREADGGSTSWQ